MAVNFTAGKFTADNDAGAPLVGGLLYTYASGTTTPKATYTSATLGTANTNPITLDARGEASVWLGSGAYTMVLKTSAGVTIWTQDGIQDGSLASAIAVDDGHSGSLFTSLQGFISYLVSAAGSSIVGFIQSGVGAVRRTMQDKARETVSVKDFGAIGDGVANDTTAINAALAASNHVFFPPGTYMTDGGHNIQGKTLVGFNRDASIIKARGTNSGVTIFTGAQTNPSAPGAWGSGGAFRLEKLGIYGNWDGTSGLTTVGTYKTGVLSANYNATTNTSLVKCVSTVYVFIKDCQFAYAHEHALMFYGNGYSEVSGNIFTTCRGSGIWFSGDATNAGTIAASTATSTTIEDNQITTCRGGNGALIMFLTYGCTVRGNLFEANVYGYNLAEGADCSFSGNYSEMGYISGDNIGIAPVLISPSIWGYSFVGEAYNPVGDYIPSAPRSAVSIDRSGIRIRGAAGYNGAGVQFPAIQAPSANANTLDDYKEGIFTPTGSGVVYATATGSYIKVGRLVTVWFSVVMPSTSDTSQFRIQSLPYAADAVAGASVANSGYAGGALFFIDSGNSYISASNFAGSSFITNANLSGKTISGSVSYRTPD